MEASKQPNNELLYDQGANMTLRIVPFDTLAYAKKLESAGINAKQAEMQSEALAGVLEENFVSKAHQNSNFERVWNEFSVMRSEFSVMRSEFTAIRNEFKQENEHTRKDLLLEIHRSKIEMIRWLIGSLFGFFALCMTAFKFFH